MLVTVGDIFDVTVTILRSLDTISIYTYLRLLQIESASRFYYKISQYHTRVCKHFNLLYNKLPPDGYLINNYTYYNT